MIVKQRHRFLSGTPISTSSGIPQVVCRFRVNVA